MVRLTCPDSAQALKIAESFGTAMVDSDGIRDLHEHLICETAEALSEGLGERAMQIHLQRIVGAFVGSAHGAGQFYSKAVTDARDATAKAANDVRDEDLDGPVGYDSAAHRKREFAADMGIQSHALRMAAEGAVAAYKKTVGETWKPFDRPVENPGHSIDRKAAEVQMSAFD
ncbi:putative tiorf60 protein [Brucella lupini]|nr:putative tiorf60 protein [Brucella lupini]